VSLRFLLKKYNTKFAGAEFIGYLAFAHDHSPAAFYGVLPCYFRIKGETILAAQSADTMTHPHHRREGLFMRLARETYALAKENKIELVFGFPNQNSLAGFVKLNWAFLPEPMKLFHFPSHPFPYLKIIWIIPFIRDAYSGFLRRKYRIENNHVNFSGDLRDGIIKDNAFLHYKTYSQTYFIQIDGIPVWIKADGILKIGYVAINKMISAESFLKKINKLAFRSGCDQVVFMTSVNTPLFKMLNPLARAEDSFPVGFYKLTDRELDFSNVQFEYCDIDIF
jgi:hypothetical protein